MHPMEPTLISPFRNNKFYMVFEYMEMNILHLLRSQYPTGFPPTLVRRVLWQVLSGLDHCHDHGVVHRDIKPENILVDSHTMHVKLCDFGFSKVVSSNDSAEMTSYVATRWYRAPELLVASTSYGPGVDIFAAGCVMAELADGDPLLPGASDLDQLRLIDHTLGSIPIYLIDMAQTNGKLLGAIGPVKRGVTLVDRFGMKLSVRALDLLQAMLSVDAKVRITAKSTLSHTYFDNIHEALQRRRSRSNSCHRRYASNNRENETKEVNQTGREDSYCNLEPFIIKNTHSLLSKELVN